MKVTRQQWRTQEFCSVGGGLTNSVEKKGQREWRQLSFGTRNLISYSKMFLIFGTLRTFMMTTNLFVIASVKQLRT